jgi:TonB family protein
MVKSGLLLALFLIIGLVSAAQQQAPTQAAQAPSAQDSAQVPSPTRAGPEPKPGADGAYFVGPEVTAPRLLRVMAAGYPYDVRPKKTAGVTVLSAVIGVDGVAKSFEVVQTHGEEFDASAINAVKLSKFAPGMLNGKPVPVRVDLRVPFHAGRDQAVPEVVIGEWDVNPPDLTPKPGKKPPSYTAPIPIHVASADFGDPDSTGKGKYPAVALVGVLVTTDGLPTEVRIVRGLGFGTDEKAVAAVKRYRFLPATDKGKVIAARRNVEVKFSLF